MVRNVLLLGLLGLLLLSPFKQANAQTANWATLFGNTLDDRPAAIARDGSGNIYVTGIIRGPVSFSGTSLTAASGGSTFICKLTPSGTLTWAKSLSSIGGNGGNAIAVDGSGNVYVTGYFTNTTDFNPGPDVNNLTNSGENDIFVLKLDTDGNYQWAQKFASARAETGTAIAVNAAGTNIYISGSFIGATTNPGTNTLSFGNGNVT